MKIILKSCNNFFPGELKRDIDKLLLIKRNIRWMMAAGVSFCLLCSANSFAQSPSIKTSVDRNNILIGQPLNYRVETTMPANMWKLNWFSIPDSFGHFEVVTKNKIDTSIVNGNQYFSQIITLTNFDSGSRVIPPLALTLQKVNSDSTFTMFTDSIPVEVSYSPLDSIQPFHDIKPILEVNNKWPWWVWCLIGLGIVLLIGLVFLLFKFFRKKKDTTDLFSSKLSPFDEAMQSLSELTNEQLIENQREKEFHTRLTYIFKRFLSRKSNTNKLHLTADQVLLELAGSDVSRDQIAAFANSLRMGNAVKFARFIPPAYENENCFSETKKMIAALNTSLSKKDKSDI